MVAKHSRSEYEARMHKVLAYIDRHLDGPLDLQTLAEVAHFSSFHFHRLFAAWMGETLGEYLRRRRIEIAAVRLVAQPRVPVLQVALSVGFGSAEAFSRAFKTRFGASPSAWREREMHGREANSNPDQMKRKIDQAPQSAKTNNNVSHQRSPETIMNVKLITRQPTAVAYMRHTGPYGESISQFWQQSVYPWMVANNLLDRPRYGISHDAPGVTALQQCRYDACVESSPEQVLSGGGLRTTIPGGQYAALSFKGSVDHIGDAWTALLRDWLPASGLQLDARPMFEHYPTDSTYDPATGVFSCEICIPVMPL